MTRRDFAKILSAPSLSPVYEPLQGAGATFGSERGDWPTRVFRRFSVDMHVPDWSPELLSRFDASEFVSLIARGGTKSMMMMANSHTGLCLWKTSVGRTHANLRGRDFFGEVVSECRKRNIHPIAYFSVIYDNASFTAHPDWRIERADGLDTILNSRYGICCPNSPYRDYVMSCTRELAANYDIDGLFSDMTFWPGVCYCSHCAVRFRQEHGQELPRIVDWDDPAWRSFQRARQNWLVELVSEISANVKRVKPITVTHQCSTIFHNWTLASPLELSTVADFPSGDFYGGATQHSLACKVYHGLTRMRPFEFVTSRTRTFTDHVTNKPAAELRTECAVATLHSAALMLVDYINADGTLNPRVYEELASVSKERMSFEPFLGGELLADAAVYYDKESMYNPDENKVAVDKLKAPDKCPHRDSVVGAARMLQRAHVPFGVITNANLDQIGRYRLVVLPNVLEMSAAQANMVRKFVNAGGAILCTGRTSLHRTASGPPEFHISDVLGINCDGTLGKTVTYLTPSADPERAAIWPQDHLSWNGPMLKARALSGANVLATITLPFVDPELGSSTNSHFAAIHSNPPALKPGDTPGIVTNRYGKGQSIWIAAPIENSEEEVNARLFKQLVDLLLPKPYAIELDAHPSVEGTLFHQADRNCFVAGLLTLQKESPHVPLEAAVRVRLPRGRNVSAVRLLPDSKSIPFEVRAGMVEFRLGPFDTISMAQVVYM